MRALAWLSTALVFAACAFGQQPAAMAGARHQPGLVPLHRAAARGFGAFPFLWGGYGDFYYPLEPSVPAVQPPASYVILQPVQPEIVRPEIHDYSRAIPGGESTEEPPAFSIALRDGSVNSAVATALQGDSLVFVDSDGGQQRIALDMIDRDATRRLNRAKGLDLRLPPSNK